MGPLAFLTWLSASLVSSSAAAQELTVELRAPEALHAGDRAEIVVLVRGAGTQPLLVTPNSEGTALEVVRGRLLRAEAVDPQAEVLEFHIPVVAHGPGAAVVRVEAAGYACARRCRAVRAEGSLVLHVLPASPEEPARKQASSKRDDGGVIGAQSALDAFPPATRVALRRAHRGQLDGAPSRAPSRGTSPAR